MATGSYQADFWYRHETDVEQTIRDRPQMTMGVTSERTIAHEIASLTVQGYNVQRVELYALCARCQGVGQIAVRPKGTRKPIAELPAWRLSWLPCPTCKGTPEYTRLLLHLGGDRV